MPVDRTFNLSMTSMVDQKTGSIVIEQHIDGPRDHLASQISRWSINTYDQMVRDALIKLGWTPPPEKSDG